MVIAKRKLWSQAALIAVLASYFASIYNRPFIYGDAIWSNVIGKWMVMHREIPHQDYWTWTAYGQAWTPQEWGFEVLLYACNHWFGFLGVVVMMTIVSVLTWWICLRILEQLNIKYPYLWVIIAAACSSAWDQLRAETFSYLFVAILMWMIVGAQQGHRKRLWVALPLEVLWVNIHGSFVYGIGIVLWFGIASLIPSFKLHWIEHTKNKHTGYVLIATAIAMAVIALLNPQTWHMYVFSFWLSFETHIAKYIMEWQPASVTEIPAAALLLEIGILSLLRIHQKKPVKLDVFVWVLGSIYLFLKAVRFGSYLIIFIPLALGPLETLEQSWIQHLFRRAPAQLIAVLKVGLVLGCSILTIETAASTHGTLSQNASETVEPQRMIAVLQSIHRSHPNWRIWNSYTVGGAIEATGIPVSIDGRTEVYLADGIMKHYVSTMAARPGTLKWLNAEQVRIVCLKKDEPLSELLSENTSWLRVYRGKTYDLYERQA